MQAGLEVISRLRDARPDEAGKVPMPSVAATAAMLRGRAAAFGITRIGDVSGLDRIGLPVWFASRPGSRHLSLAQGKGLTDDAAIVSAVMESVEGAAAERTENLVQMRASMADLKQAGMKMFNPEAFQRCRTLGRQDQVERGWVPGLSWVSGNKVFVPAELVCFDLRPNAPLDHAAFEVSTVGLAAGTDWGSAILHGLLEQIENDALVLCGGLNSDFSAARPLAVEAGHSAELDQLIERIARIGIDPVFVDVSSDVDLPVIACFLPRSLGGEASGKVRYCFGSCCHIDPHQAAVRALLEAAQARTTYIAGARDDMTRNSYQTAQPLPTFAAQEASWLHQVPRGLDGASTADPAGIVAALYDVGIQETLIVPIPTPFEDICVVRVIAERLESPFHGGWYEMGLRGVKAMFGSMRRRPCAQ